MSFAENLKAVRREKALSQEDLAELMGVSRQAVSKWEQGEGYPEMEKALLLSRRLNVSLDYLMSGETGMNGAQQAAPSGRLLIRSFDGKAVVNCYRVQTSQAWRTGADEPKCALFGTDGSSAWGEHTVLLGWYATVEDAAKETREIMAAMERGKTSYELQYAAKVKVGLFHIRMEP